MTLTIICALLMGFSLGALGLLGLYIAMVLAFGIACSAVFVPFGIWDLIKNKKFKGR